MSPAEKVRNPSKKRGLKPCGVGDLKPLFP